MALIVDYGTLQGEIATTLNRDDLTVSIRTFIQSAEGKFRRDYRTRKLLNRTFLVSTEDVDLPTDYNSLQDLYHDGTEHFGPIEIVPAEKLGELKALHGTSGVPRFAAILDTVIRFVPAPTGTFTLKMTYWRKVPSLSDAATTNWLILDHPDIYLYGALLESAPFLKNDNRLPMWKGELNDRLEELHRDTEDHHWAGRLIRRPSRPL